MNNTFLYILPFTGKKAGSYREQTPCWSCIVGTHPPVVGDLARVGHLGPEKQSPLGQSSCGSREQHPREGGGTLGGTQHPRR